MESVTGWLHMELWFGVFSFCVFNPYSLITEDIATKVDSLLTTPPIWTSHCCLTIRTLSTMPQTAACSRGIITYMNRASQHAFKLTGQSKICLKPQTRYLPNSVLQYEPDILTLRADHSEQPGDEESHTHSGVKHGNSLQHETNLTGAACLPQVPSHFNALSKWS